MKRWKETFSMQKALKRAALLALVLSAVSLSDHPGLLATGGHWELSPYSSSVEFCNPPDLLCAEWEFDNGFVGPTCCIQSQYAGTGSGNCVWDITVNGPFPAARPGID